MPSSRRTFLKQTGLAVGVAGLVGTYPHTPQAAILKPPRLQEGQTVGLISPASATYEPVRIEIMEETLPEWDGHILFLEDIGEDVYRVDRMLTQLKLAGVLDRLAGFIFGKCTDCDPDSAYSSFTLEEVLTNHVQSLGIPAWHGAMIGHIEDKFTVPLGIEVEIDAETGIIQMLEPAVR